MATASAVLLQSVVALAPAMRSARHPNSKTTTTTTATTTTTLRTLQVVLVLAPTTTPIMVPPSSKEEVPSLFNLVPTEPTEQPTEWASTLPNPWAPAASALPASRSVLKQAASTLEVHNQTTTLPAAVFRLTQTTTTTTTTTTTPQH